MHLESHLPALNHYAKALVRGKPHIDYRDVVNEAVLACLIANPPELDQGYVLSAARSRFFNIVKQPTHYELKDDYSFWVIPPEAEVLIYAKQRRINIFNTRGKVSINREKRRSARCRDKNRERIKAKARERYADPAFRQRLLEARRKRYKLRSKGV